MHEYTRVNWEDAPIHNTPVNAENLNRMDVGIAAIYADLSEVVESLSGLDASVVTSLIPTETELAESEDVAYIASNDYTAGDYAILTDRVYKIIADVNIGEFIIPAADDATEEEVSTTVYTGMTPNAVLSSAADALRWWFDTNKNAIPMDDAPTEDSTRAVTSDGVLSAIISERPLWVNFGTITSLPVDKYSELIKADMKCTQIILGDPSAELDSWTVSIIEGCVTVNGSIASDTSLELKLERVREI